MITWVVNEAEGRARASAENKPVLIDFGAEWCAGCKELEHNTFPHAGVRTEAQRFVAIKVAADDPDAPDTAALQKKYGVVGLPTVIMLDSAGNEITRFNKFVEPAPFVAAQGRQGCASRLAWALASDQRCCGGALGCAEA